MEPPRSSVATQSAQPGADLKHHFSALWNPPQVALPHTHMHARPETNCTDERLRQGWSVKKPQALVASDNSPVMPWSLLMKALPSNPGLLHYEQCWVHQVLFFTAFCMTGSLNHWHAAPKPCTADRVISSRAFLVAVALSFPKIN